MNTEKESSKKTEPVSTPAAVNTPGDLKARNVLKLLKVLIILTVAFIWGHSMMSRTASSGESGFVFRLIGPFLELFLGKGNVTEHLVRKLAHFTEYFALGAELAAYQLIRFRIKSSREAENCEKKSSDTETVIKQFLPALSTGLLIAAIDETIQIFSGRGPSVKDVLLDFSGVATACIIVCIIFHTRRTLKERSADNPGGVSHGQSQGHFS